MATLFELNDQMREIERILEENGGELTDELATVWEETETSLRRKVDNYFQFIKNKEAEAKSLDEMAKHFAARKKTAENCVKQAKMHIAECMSNYNIDKMEGDMCIMSLRKSQSLEVDDNQVLHRYLDRINDLKASLPSWMEVTIKVSKTAIKEAFKDTDLLPEGVSRTTNKSLNIR